MNILLQGAGAVGLGLASYLLKSGQRVDLIGRGDTVTALQKNGLARTGIFGDFTAAPDSFGVYVSLSDLPQTIYDFLLVCTKSFDTRTSSEQIAAIPFLKNAGKVCRRISENNSSRASTASTPCRGNPET